MRKIKQKKNPSARREAEPAGFLWREDRPGRERRPFTLLRKDCSRRIMSTTRPSREGVRQDPADAPVVDVAERILNERLVLVVAPLAVDYEFVLVVPWG